MQIIEYKTSNNFRFRIGRRLHENWPSTSQLVEGVTVTTTGMSRSELIGTRLEGVK